jgi:hypothetical protein
MAVAQKYISKSYVMSETLENKQRYSFTTKHLFSDKMWTNCVLYTSFAFLYINVQGNKAVVRWGTLLRPHVSPLHLL